MYELSYYCVRFKLLKEILSYIGKKTMPILFLHFIAFKIVNIFVVLLLHKKIELISTYPVLYKNDSWWILYCIAGVVFPIAIDYITKNLKYKKEWRDRLERS